MREEERAVYIISIAAELSGVHPQTLRVYERRGLVEPQRTSGGARRYSPKDIQRMRRINELTDLGLNLVGVQMVLALEEQVEAQARRIDAMGRELHVLRDYVNQASTTAIIKYTSREDLIGE